MMKKPFILSLSLILVLMAACTPSASPANPTEPPTVALPTPTVVSATFDATQVAPTEAATAVPLATSRGPNLEATDPTTVSLASGGLQFVEFFRFT